MADEPAASKGLQGVQGVQGFQGVQGEQGPSRGERGEQGEQGLQGEPGPPGLESPDLKAWADRLDRRLGEVVRGMAHHRRRTRTAVFFAALSLVTAVLTGVALSAVYLQGQTRERDRQEELVGRCHQYNDQAGRAREFAIDASRDLVKLALALRQGVPLPPGTKPALDAYTADQAALAGRTYPFRDCTDTGIAAFQEKTDDPVPCKPDGKGFCRP